MLQRNIECFPNGLIKILDQTKVLPQFGTEMTKSH